MMNGPFKQVSEYLVAPLVKFLSRFLNQPLFFIFQFVRVLGQSRVEKIFKTFQLMVRRQIFQITKREVPLPEDLKEEGLEHGFDRFTSRKNNCAIFLGYTSNMASCGVRDTIRFLVQHKMVIYVGSFRLWYNVI